MDNNFENINQSQIPPASSTRKYIWIVLIVFVLVMISILFWAFNKEDKLKTEQAGPALTVSNVKNTLLTNSKISFPEIENEKVVDISNINNEVSTLITRGSENKDLQVSKVNYINGKVGQIIKFNIDKPLFDYYREIQGKSVSNKWSIIFGSRGILATILEIENKILTVRILGGELTKNSTNVYIQTIQK